MNRYFILSNFETLEVIGAPYEEAPDNSLPYFNHSFVKPVFDVYPNPTNVIEGATQEEIEDFNRGEVPFEVPLWRVRVILKLMDLEQTVENVLNTFEEPNKTAALYLWQFGTLVERQSPTVLMLQQILELNNNQTDDIFIQANNIQL
jgi:hypothetical protein